MEKKIEFVSTMEDNFLQNDTENIKTRYTKEEDITFWQGRGGGSATTPQASRYKQPVVSIES
jgi:hypothetical protein